MTTFSKFACPLNQVGFRSKVAPSAVFNSLRMYGPETTVGVRISGLAAGSVHDLPCQTCFGTGEIVVATPIATSFASVSFRTTTNVFGSGAVNDSIRSRSSSPT